MDTLKETSNFTYNVKPNRFVIGSRKFIIIIYYFSDANWVSVLIQTKFHWSLPNPAGGGIMTPPGPCIWYCGVGGPLPALNAAAETHTGRSHYHLYRTFQTLQISDREKFLSTLLNLQNFSDFAYFLLKVADNFDIKSVEFCRFSFY